MRTERHISTQRSVGHDTRLDNPALFGGRLVRQWPGPRVAMLVIEAAVA